MCPSLIEIGSKTAERNSAQTNRQTDRQTDRQTNRHYENNGHLAVNQLLLGCTAVLGIVTDRVAWSVCLSVASCATPAQPI